MSLPEQPTIAANKASPLGSRRLKPLFFAAPALLVPAIVAFIIFWARHKFYQQSATAFDGGASTISRSISEPGIAAPFAIVVSFAAVLLAQVVWRIIKLYHSTINAVFADNARYKLVAKSVLTAAGIGQSFSITGILLLIWLSERTLHIGGSYLFFSGQASAILFSGILCGMLIKTPAYNYARGWPATGLCPRLSLWRSRVAPPIAAAAVLFWILFIYRDTFDNHPPYWVNVSFAMLEFGLIISFLLYLAVFFFELYRSQKASR